MKPREVINDTANSRLSLGRGLLGRITPMTVVWVILWVLLITFPMMTDSRYLLGVGVLVLITGIGAYGLNIIFGYTGQVSMFHGALYGVGAYATGIVAIKLGWNVWASMGVGAVAAGVVGLLVGIPCLRTKGPYFGIGSLAFGLIVTLLIQKMSWLTAGVRGLVGIPHPDPIVIPLLGTIDFSKAITHYYLAVVVLAITLFFSRRLITSLTGKVLLAICQQNEVLVSSLGINVWRTKVMSFVVSSVVTGFAGSLFAIYFCTLTPDISNYNVGVNFLMKVLIGGQGTLIGPIIGSVVISVIAESLQAIGDYRLLVYGVLLILVLIFVPNGIVGGVQAIWQTLTNRLAHRSSVKESETTPGGAYE